MKLFSHDLFPLFSGYLHFFETLKTNAHETTQKPKKNYIFIIVSWKQILQPSIAYRTTKLLNLLYPVVNVRETESSKMRWNKVCICVWRYCSWLFYTSCSQHMRIFFLPAPFVSAPPPFVRLSVCLYISLHALDNFWEPATGSGYFADNTNLYLSTFLGPSPTLLQGLTWFSATQTGCRWLISYIDQKVFSMWAWIFCWLFCGVMEKCLSTG